MKLNSQELNKLLEQVSDDVAAVLAKAEESEKTLAKASPGEEAPGEETPSGSSAEGSQPESAPEASPAPEGAPDAGPPEGSPAEEAQETPAEESQEQTQNPAEDESAGPEALVSEYAKLPIEELKMHVMASHAALMQAIGGQPGAEGGAPEGQPEAPAPEGASPEGTQAPGQEEPPMGKKEFSSEGSGGKIVKSEGKALEARLEKLEKSLKAEADKSQTLEAKLVEATEGLRKFVEKSGNQAMRKSIANISFDKKPGDTEGKEVITLSKSEAVKKLNSLTADHEKMGKLEKSDREKISQYILGTVPQTEISHLLK